MDREGGEAESVRWEQGERKVGIGAEGYGWDPWVLPSPKMRQMGLLGSPAPAPVTAATCTQ